MNIYIIKELTEKTSPYFFSPQTLKFFGQTLGKFSVKKQKDGKYLISCPMKNKQGEIIGCTQRLFNPQTNELEHITN